MIDQEDFELWRDNPITLAVVKRLDAVASECQARWSAMLTTPSADARALELLRAELAAKIEFVTEFRGLSLEDIQDEQES